MKKMIFSLVYADYMQGESTNQLSATLLQNLR